MSETLLKNFTDEPIILQVDGGDKGAIYLDKDSRLRITLESSDAIGSHKKQPTEYVGAFSGAYVKIAEPRTISSKTWWGTDRQVSQIGVHYRYVLVTTGKDALSSDKVSSFNLTFPALFHNPVQPKNATVKNKTLEISITTDNSNNVSTIDVKPKKKITIDEAIQYRTRLERFFTSYLDMPIQSQTTTLVIKDSLVSYITSNRPVHTPVVDVEPKIIQPVTNVAELLLKYTTNFKSIGYATHLHASYIEYRDKNIYLESQLSVLFAGIDSIYSKLPNTPNSKETARAESYETFLSEISDVDVIKKDKKLLKFLQKLSTKQNYVSPISFQVKLNTVYDFTDVDRLSSAVSERINTLRNNIAHGNDYDFDDFVTEWTDPKTGKIYPAITGEEVKGVSNVLWIAVRKLANQ